MTRITLLLACLLLAGCGLPQGYEQERDEMMRLIRLRDSMQTQHAFRIADSLLAVESEFEVRWWSDSLARVDSLDIGYLYAVKSAQLYESEDLVGSTYMYLKALPWMGAMRPRKQVMEWNFYSQTVGDAVIESKSVNMASMAWQAFHQAERLAAELGDSTLARRTLEAKLDLNQRLYSMPDSVRLAFAPAPAPTSTPPWGGILAIAIGFIVGAGGLGAYKLRKRALPHKALRFSSESTEALMQALWIASNKPEDVPEDVCTVVQGLCRKPTNQRAMFMTAGLMVLKADTPEADPLKLANAVRSRLLRHFKKHQWAFGPGVLLPREQDEWLEWFKAHPDTVTPVVSKEPSRLESALWLLHARKSSNSA